jgi:hypothetical protein
MTCDSFSPLSRIPFVFSFCVLLFFLLFFSFHWSGGSISSFLACFRASTFCECDSSYSSIFSLCKSRHSAFLLLSCCSHQFFIVWNTKEKEFPSMHEISFSTTALNPASKERRRSDTNRQRKVKRGIKPPQTLQGFWGDPHCDQAPLRDGKT